MIIEKKIVVLPSIETASFNNLFVEIII